MQLQDTFKVTGNIVLRRYDENGILNLEREHKNLVVTTGKELIASRLYSNTTKIIPITNVSPFKVLTTTAAAATTASASSSTINNGLSGAALGAGTILTVTGTPAVPFAVGMALSGGGTTLGTYITSLGTGTGGAGTYNVNISQNIASSVIIGYGATLSFANQTVAPFIVGTEITVDGITPLVYNTTPTLAITGASGNGTTATVTFTNQTVAPFANGEKILISGVSPTGYNGTFKVTACTQTSVSYANTTQTGWTSGGKVRTELLTSAIVTACTQTSVSYTNKNITTGTQTVPGTIQPIGATMSFALQTGAPYYSSAPFEQGAYATISGVNITSYNNSFRIKTAGTTFITVDSNETQSASGGQINSLKNGTIKTMRIGESNTAANLSDTALGSQVGSVALFSRSYTNTNGTADVNYIALFPAGNGTSTVGITEAALMNDDNTMLCRTVFPPVTKSELESLEIFWTVTIN
jgi:hypothetical protein